MVERMSFLFTFVAVIGSALVAGVFFAFSSFVMPALGRLPADQGVAAMQSINVTVLTPSFMLALFGTALICITLAVASYAGWEQAGAKIVLVACVIYLVGCIGVTMTLNVPLNDLLAGVRPDTSEAGELWSRYLGEWTRWNHVRTIASAAAGVLFTWAMLQRGVG